MELEDSNTHFTDEVQMQKPKRKYKNLGFHYTENRSLLFGFLKGLLERAWGLKYY